MRWSSQGDEAAEKQQSSGVEEPEEMQRWGDQDEAVHKQPRADEDIECPGLDHPGQNKKERPNRNDRSGAEQAAGAATPRTGTSGDKWRPDTPDRRIRDGTRSRGSRPSDWNNRGQAAADRHGRDRRPRRAREAATRARQRRCREAEWRTRPGRGCSASPTWCANHGDQYP